MNDDQLLRYSRQIMLPQVDIAGQQKLRDSTVFIVGLGGLGSPIAMYLAAAGVGHLIINDFDNVDLSNLQRQIIHHSDNIGLAKTESSQIKLKAINPEVKISLCNEKLEAEKLVQQVQQADLVVDASDNFTTRFRLNQACVNTKVPLISGAAIRMEGQVSVFRNDLDNSPCYRCLYKDEQELEESCSETGVLAPVVGIIGSIQATEALKLLLGIGEGLAGRLLVLDALDMEVRIIRLKKDPLCPICSH
jgi:molybdopterin/thiamine biosynthesis adenylyltransferase